MMKKIRYIAGKEIVLFRSTSNGVSVFNRDTVYAVPLKDARRLVRTGDFEFVEEEKEDDKKSKEVVLLPVEDTKDTEKKKVTMRPFEKVTKAVEIDEDKG